MQSAFRQGELPAELSSFVDRVEDLAEVGRTLSSSRLVTLTGVAGVGKTRLALRAAAAARPAFPDGVYLIDLSSLPDADLLAHAMALAFQLQDQTARPMSDVVADYLADRQVLLVMDTAELHVEACAELLTALLQAAPRVRVLVTSRQVLGLLGEHIITVPPLRTAGPGRPVDATDNPAVRLFAERAVAVNPAFALTRRTESTVARLCQRLEGLPLAIELAAAWLRVLSVEEVEASLERGFELLRGTDRGAPWRHQTLRQAIGWSHQLCDPIERLMWTRLSCFPASFDLQAVEEVCSDPQLPAEQAFDLVSQLVDKSVVLVEQYQGAPRYRLLDTVREYGREWLRAPGEEDALARRHRDYYLRLAERAEAGWFGPDQPQTLARLALEHANLQAALEFSLTTDGEQSTGLRLAGTLWFFWQDGGLLGEGRHWLDRALELDPTPSAARTKALWSNSHLAHIRGELAASARMAEASRDQAQRDGDEYAVACANQALGVAVLLTGREPQRALELLEQSLAYHVAAGDAGFNEALSRLCLATAAAYFGQPERANALAEELVSICEQRGELTCRSFTLYILALVASAQQQPERALAHIRECLPIFHTLGQLPGIAMTVELLALLIAASGAAEPAAVLHGAAEQVWQVVGTRAFGSPHVNETHVACEALARKTLGDNGYEDAYRRGSELDLDTAVDYALRAALSARGSG